VVAIAEDSSENLLSRRGHRVLNNLTWARDPHHGGDCLPALQ